MSFAAAGLALAACDLPQVVDGTDDGSLPEGEAITESPRAALNPTEIEVFLRDSTLSHQSDELVWHVYLGRDGSLTGLARGEDGRQVQRARGRWEVTEDGFLCRQWDGSWGGGASGCAQVYQFGTDFVFVVPGATIEDGIRRRRTPGDSQNVL
ncbi:MAG: hypothetical protein AAF416_07785 [Pseudomonadota bacterium]